MIAAVFSIQGTRQLAAAIIILIVTVGFRDLFAVAKANKYDLACQIAADYSWQIIIGTGILPALFALYYCITISEILQYTFDVAQDIEKGNTDIQTFKDRQSDGQVDALKQQHTILVLQVVLTQPRASWADFFEYFGNWKNRSLLFGTIAV
jgi:MFS transporter, PHS family, inorganic phosphate transporter